MIRWKGGGRCAESAWIPALFSCARARSETWGAVKLGLQRCTAAFLPSSRRGEIGGRGMAEANVQEVHPETVAPHQPVRAAVGAVKFAKNNEFQAALKRRVDEFFARTGRPRRDVPQMYMKTAILLASFAAVYVILVFVARAWWQGVPLAVLLGLITAAIGFNIQHDGGHQAYSEHPWVNKLMALTLDLIGGSSYRWHYKHGVLHHTFVNITHEDPDITLGM